MRLPHRTTAPALSALLVLTALLAAPAQPASASFGSASPVGCVHQQAVTGPCPEWTTTHSGPAGTRQPDRLLEVVMSPDDRTIFATGASWDDKNAAVDLTTMALDNATGQVRWAVTRGGSRTDQPASVAVSADGAVVYVGGEQDQYFDGSKTSSKYLVVAYDAETGRELWTSTHGGADEVSSVTALAVDATTVYVTGRSGPTSLTTDVVTLALDHRTGEKRWAARFAGPSEDNDPGPFSVVDLDFAADMAVSPAGDMVVVAGTTYTDSNTASTLLLAYDASGAGAGELRWVSTDGWGGAANLGKHVEISPDGRTAYLVAEQGNEVYDRAGLACCAQRSAFGITAHDTGSGQTLWRTTFAGPHGELTPPQAAALHPSGDVLAVVGRANGPGPLFGQGQTVAVDTATGDLIWQATHAVPGATITNWAGVAFDGDGQRVFVTGNGISQQRVRIATVAYDTATGTTSWGAAYTADPTTTPAAFATSLAVTRDGQGVIVTGGVARTEAAADRGDHLVMRYSLQ